MKILVAGRAEIEKGIPVRTPYVVISVYDPGKSKPNIPRAAGFRGVLFLQFHDAEPSPGFELPAEIVLMTADDARAIWNFVRQYRNTVGTIVVHCEQGMSRSPAIAAALSRVLGEDEARFFAEYQPNKYIYDLLLATRAGGEHGPMDVADFVA